MTAMFLITLVSIVSAVVMTIVAWRLGREERRRSAARVAALASEVQRDAVPDLPLRAVAIAPLLTPPADIGGRSRIAATIAAGVFIVGSGAALAVVMSGSFSSSREQPGIAASNAAVRPDQASRRPALPLELMALSHERDGNTLTVRGVVRNPAGSAEVDKLAAVVFLFGADGSFTTSTRATADRAVLPGGAESSFRVVIPDAGDVARYRVSFRTDRAVVPHVDRRAASAQEHR